MPQVSRPLLIALVAVVGLAGVWMTVLRPRAQGGEGAQAAPAGTGAAAPAHAAPGMKGLGNAVQAAHGAVATSEASAAKTEAAVQAAGTGATTPAAPAMQTAPAAPATQAAPAAPPRATHAARTTVLLFAGDGADDVAARALVRSIDQPGVRTIVASTADLGRYGALVGDVRIEILPTILVVGSDHHAQRIVGLPDRAQVMQALAAAR